MKEAGQVLRNEKVKTNDEFLVKKKQPLIKNCLIKHSRRVNLS